MKLSEYKGEKALDLLADIIEPVAEIASDVEVRNAAEKKDKLKVVKLILKSHKKSIMEIMAAIDETPVNEYQVNILTLPVKLLEILNDKDLWGFFTSAEPTEEQNAFTDSVENIEAPSN